MYLARTLLVLLFGLVLAHFASANVYASSLSAATILQDFNAVVYTNASTPSDIEGAAVIGGNFNGATVYTHPTASLPTGFGALTVYGNTSGNLNVNNGGSVYVAGSKGAAINFNGGGSYIPAPANTIADFETALNAFSTSLSALAATSGLPTAGNNEAIKARPNTAGTAVFNITSAQLAAIPSYRLNLNGASTVIFNVSGALVNFNANDESGTLGADNIIWNFYDATSVNLFTEIAGTVLAPLANVSNSSPIDGALVANSWTGSGELHDYGFTDPVPPTPVTSTPEPASWTAMLLGLGVIACGLRLRHLGTAK
jgi:choice-of-anchor A domain-containing protein